MPIITSKKPKQFLISCFIYHHFEISYFVMVLPTELNRPLSDKSDKDPLGKYWKTLNVDGMMYVNAYVYK